MAVTYEDLRSECAQVTLYDRYFTALCPFHHDTAPSLLVFKDGWFRCLGSCGRNGTWLTLWNKLKGQPVQVMPERLTRWGTPGIPANDLESVCYQAHIDLLSFPSLGWYLEMRGIDNRIETNELGFWNGWYTIPVHDDEGNFITGVFRSAPHVQEATGLRYWCRHQPVMYAPDWRLYANSDVCYVVFGMVDALVLASLRLAVVTTTGGSNAFNTEWLDDYRHKVVIVPDRGEEPSASKVAKNLGWRGQVLRLPYPDGYKDPADFAARGKSENLRAMLMEAK